MNDGALRPGDAFQTEGAVAVAPTGIVLLDWDNTLWPGFTVLEFSRLLVEHELMSPHTPMALEEAHGRYEIRLKQVPEDTNRRAEVYDDFAVEAERLYIGGLIPAESKRLEEVGQAFAAGRPPYPSTTRLLLRIREQGWVPVIVSGAPIEPVRAFAAGLGIDSVVAWQLLATNGVARPGLLLGNTARRRTKERLVASLLEEPNLTVVAAFGDSDADEPLLRSAALGVLVNPRKLQVDGSPTASRLPPIPGATPSWLRPGLSAFRDGIVQIFGEAE